MKWTPYISGSWKAATSAERSDCNGEVALNIGLGETLVGIEILDAKFVFGAEELPDLVVENVRLAASG